MPHLYSLDLPPFPFRALASRAAQAPNGPEREIALATLLAARLVHGTLPPMDLDQGDRRKRSVAARDWLGGITMPAPCKTALGRLIDATAGGGEPMRLALDRVTSVTAPYLDLASHSELTLLARNLPREDG